MQFSYKSKIKLQKLEHKNYNASSQSCAEQLSYLTAKRTNSQSLSAMRSLKIFLAEQPSGKRKSNPF